MTGEIAIRSAELKDIPDIIDIQKSLLLKNKTIKSAKKEGFLVYPIGEEELGEIIQLKENFLFVAVVGDKIVGYALAYSLDEWKNIKHKWSKRILVTSQVKNHLFKDKFIYFRHIARKSNYSGIGGKLEEKVYVVAKSRGFEFSIAEILESPILNEKSKIVHEERGYKKIGHVNYLDGNFWGLYEKELA